MKRNQDPGEKYCNPRAHAFRVDDVASCSYTYDISKGFNIGDEWNQYKERVAVTPSRITIALTTHRQIVDNHRIGLAVAVSAAK